MGNSSHVPAWKKLGLQLKFAKDAPNKQQSEEQERKSGQTIGNNALSKLGKRKAESEQTKETSSSKAIDENTPTKAKQSTEPNREAKRLKSSKHNSKKSNLQSQPTVDGEEKPARKSKKGRKSVSFASDTKSDDDSSPVEVPSDIDNDPDAVNARRAEKRRKREERQKSRSSQQPQSESQPQDTNSSDPMLTYITTYHNSRSEWKFQKNRETAVLKHALSIERIPPSYAPALSVYLSGLKGEAAKKRIGLGAKEIITEDDDNNEASESGETRSQRAIYDKALESFRKHLTEQRANPEKQGAEGEADHGELNSDWLKRLNKRKRAELVYFVTQGDILQEKPPQLKKLKRKARTTAVVSDSSSSSSSSSESDSDDDTSSSPSSSSDSDSSSTSSGSSSDSDSSDSKSSSESDSE